MAFTEKQIIIYIIYIGTPVQQFGVNPIGGAGILVSVASTNWKFVGACLVITVAFLLKVGGSNKY